MTHPTVRPATTARRTRWRRRLIAVPLTAVVVAGGLGALPAGAASIDDKRAEAARVADQLEALEDELMDLGGRHEQAMYEFSKAQERVEEAQARVDQTSAELDLRRGEVRTFAVDAYKQGEDSSTLDALLTTEPSDAPAKKSYIEVAAGNRQDLIDAMASARRDAEEETARLDQARAEAERHSSELEETQEAAAAAVEAQQALKDRVGGELATLLAEEEARRAAERQAAQEAAASEAAQREAALAQSTTRAQPPNPTTPATPAPAPRPGPAPAPVGSAPAPSAPAPPPMAPPRSGVQGAIDAAVSKVGAPYVWGSAGPNTFDCSGLLVWAFGQVGISLPHYSGAQYNITTRISRDQLQPGDLVFWGPGGSEHVALYMGGNQIVHAFSSRANTSITHLDGWWKPPSGYGRIR